MDVAKYCTICGQGLVATAVVCIKCGSAVAPSSPMQGLATPKAKKKTTALVLAIFLGYWTWLYTFKKDKFKFLVGVVSTIAVALFAAIQEFLNSSINSALANCNLNWLLDLPHPNCNLLPQPDETLFILNRVIAIAIYLWAVIVTARRSREFFTSL